MLVMFLEKRISGIDFVAQITPNDVVIVITTEPLTSHVQSGLYTGGEVIASGKVELPVHSA